MEVRGSQIRSAAILGIPRGGTGTSFVTECRVIPPRNMCEHQGSSEFRDLVRAKEWQGQLRTPQLRYSQARNRRRTEVGAKENQGAPNR